MKAFSIAQSPQPAAIGIPHLSLDEIRRQHEIFCKCLCFRTSNRWETVRGMLTSGGVMRQSLREVLEIVRFSHGHAA